MKRFPVPGLLFILAAVFPAHAEEMTFKPAFDAPLKGPGAALGAVIWSHGADAYYGVADITLSSPADFVRSLRDAGWDVYRLNRPQVTEELKRSVSTLRKNADDLKQQGYRKVVLAGQSAGAWISIIVAGQSESIYAVIADAPAYRGVNWGQKERNATELYDNLATITHGRLMVSFFANDPFDPGGRGPKTDEILTKASVAHLIIDTPSGFSGHGAGSSAFFARQFGQCVLAMVGDNPVPTRDACEVNVRDNVPSAEFPIPKDLEIAAPQGGPSDRYLGKWYGTYPNGREFMLVIEAVTGDKIDAAYISGPLGTSPAATSQRQGRIAPEALVFERQCQPTLTYRLREDGDLDARWDAADGRSSLTTVMRRLP